MEVINLVDFILIDDNCEVHYIIKHLLQSARFLNDIPWELTSYFSSEEYINNLNKYSKSIVLLDVELPNMNGLELANKISVLNNGTYIIFLTSYEHYMKDAFGLNVFNYILKKDISTYLLIELEKLVNKIYIENNQSIQIYSHLGETQLYQDEIICVLYENRKPTIYTKKGKLIVYRETMKSFRKKINSNNFLIPNSASIVNIQYVKYIKHNYIYLLFLDIKLSISRDKIKNVNKHQREYYILGDSL